jgi:hypothetical protein
VAHVDDALSAGPQIGDDRQQLLDLSRLECRGRLVHYDHPRPGRQSPRDLDGLLGCHTQPADRRVGIDRHPEPCEDLGCLPGFRPPIDQALGGDVLAEPDIVCRRQGRHEVELLMHDRDPSLPSAVRITRAELHAFQ